MAVERWAGFLHKPWKIPRQHSATTERTAYEGHHWLLRQGQGKQRGNVMVVLNFIQADQEQILRSHWLLMTRIEISLAKISIFIPSACVNLSLYLKKSFSYCKNKICKDFRPLCVWPSCYGLKDAVDWFNNGTGTSNDDGRTRNSLDSVLIWSDLGICTTQAVMWLCLTLSVRCNNRDVASKHRTRSRQTGKSQGLLAMSVYFCCCYCWSKVRMYLIFHFQFTSLPWFLVTHTACVVFLSQCWEYAIKRCRDLSEQYEKETFDFIQLSQILVRPQWLVRLS